MKEEKKNILPILLKIEGKEVKCYIDLDAYEIDRKYFYNQTSEEAENYFKQWKQD